MSSLLNRLAAEDIAIVTPIAGTTRDHVRATIHLEGVPIHLIDTAGLRETDDPVEKVGIVRTWAAIERAGAAMLIAEAGEMAGRAEAEILNRLPRALPVVKPGTAADICCTSVMPREVSESDLIADTDSGTSCNACSRRWAVTTMSPIPLLDCASAIAGHITLVAKRPKPIAKLSFPITFLPS